MFWIHLLSFHSIISLNPCERWVSPAISAYLWSVYLLVYKVFICRENPRRSGPAFNFCRPSQIYRPIATILPLILAMNLAGNGKCAKNWNLRDRETGTQQFGGLVMSEIHRRRPRRYKFEFSFVGNDRRPSQKSGTRRENRNAPDSPDLSPSIPDDRRSVYNLLVFTGTVGKQ